MRSILVIIIASLVLGGCVPIKSRTHEYLLAKSIKPLALPPSVQSKPLRAYVNIPYRATRVVSPVPLTPPGL